MLVLTRKSEEKIVIGKKKQIVITILKIQGDKVSIGIEAPDDEPIMRKELYERSNDGEARRRNKEALLQLQTEAQKKTDVSPAMAEIKSVKTQQLPLTNEEPQNGMKEGSPGKGSPGRGNASLGKRNLAGITGEDL